MDTSYFYDESDAGMFPPKPRQLEKPKGMITISLNFVFYLLFYFFVFNGNIRFLAAVLLVMFIHEFGHFIMMKRYGYVDQRMFFIPFMSFFLGKNEEQPQITLKQKLLILFFGPLPGIVLGSAALWYGREKGNEEVINLAWIFLVWNIVNLIPLEALDGGQISETLFRKQSFVVQLVVTIIISLFVLAYAVFAQNFFSVIIPFFLGMRLQSIHKMNKLRERLEERGLDLNLGFDELNNKQYWLIRKELMGMSKFPGQGEATDEFTESIYEGMIIQNIRAVMLNRPYDDLGKSGRNITLLIWILLFVVPVVVLSFSTALKF